MENNNINLLDLNNDVLNIIGDYVKKDNHNRMEKDYYKRKDEESKKCIFKYVNGKVREMKREYNIKERPSVILFIYHCFGECGFDSNSEIIIEYLTLKKLV